MLTKPRTIRSLPLFLVLLVGICETSGTRWDSNRVIDWGMQNTKVCSGSELNTKVKFSDHKGVWFNMCNIPQDNQRGRLKPAPQWSKPQGLSSEVWLEELEKMWNILADTDPDFLALASCLQRSGNDCPPVVLQETWDLFQKNLNKVFYRTLQNVHSQACGELKTQTQALLKQSGFHQKGSVGKHQFVNCATKLAGNHVAGEKLRKIRRKLARCHEVKRQFLRNRFVDPSLLCKLWPEDFRDISGQEALDRALESIRRLHTEQEVEELAQKSMKIQNWKCRMSQGTFRELSKWLQSKTAGSNGVTVGNADSPKQAAQLIADHWKNLWSDHDTTVQQASSALTHDFGPVQNVDWVEEISEGDLLSAVRRAKGSAGPDHWAGSEVQFLPSKAIAVWHQIISRQWHVAQKLPNQLKESRQVSLPKTNKIKNGFLEPGSTRPITVLSVWWRVYASAVLQSQSVQSWYSQNLHPDVCYGKGSPGAEILAQVLQDTLAEKSGFLACMDWKQAYDRMRPAVTVDLLRNLNWPDYFCNPLMEAWGNQQRWISWEGEVLRCPQWAGNATPQGCPCAPLVLAIWASAGLRATSEPNSRMVTKVYMDDRSWWSNSLETTLTQIERWERWSATVGFCESPEKTKIIAKGKRFESQLLSAPQNWIASELRILGAVTVTKRRKYHEVEQERIDRAVARAVMLRSACLPWGRALEAFKLFINSILSFGWIAQLPTQATVNQFLRFFNHAVGFSARQASPYLRQVIYGAKFDISSIVLQRLWARATKLYHLGHLSWTKAYGSSIWTLRKRLQALGWQELRPYSWHCHLGTISVNTPIEGIGESLHLVRCSWREKQFEKWLQQKRREPQNMLQTHSKEQLLDFFRSTNLKALRSHIRDQGWWRHVALGATVSPAAYVNMTLGRNGYDISCPYCSHLIGSWDHVAWHCPHFAVGRPSKPANPLMARFGWPVVSQGKKDDLIILTYLAQVAATVVKDRREPVLCTEAD